MGTYLCVEEIALPRNQLTNLMVKSLKGPNRVGDGGGLWLSVQNSGAKQWTVRFTLDGKRREMGLGSYPIITLEEAREKALEARRLVKQGVDPIAEKRRSSSILSFAQAAREVHRINAPSWKNAKHGAQFISTLETYTFPHFGDLSIASIQSQHILSALQPIWLSKPETARRVKQRIGKVMEWSMAQGWRIDNPVDAATAGLPKQNAPKNRRKALPYREVPALIDAVQASGAAPLTKLAFEFLVLTAGRSGEVRESSWSEINETEQLWVIPGDRMKAGQEHRVALPGRAFQILEEARMHSDGSDLIFSGSRYGKPLSDATLRKLVRSLGFEVDIHGFRSSFRTWASEQTDYRPEIPEMALAHSVGNAVQRAYARTDLLDKRRALMEDWAEYCYPKQED